MNSRLPTASSPVATRAAEEVCPVWPGQPMTADWAIRDPAAVDGNDEARVRAFSKAFRDARLKIFTGLGLDRLTELGAERPLGLVARKNPRP